MDRELLELDPLPNMLEKARDRRRGDGGGADLKRDPAAIRPRRPMCTYVHLHHAPFCSFKKTRPSQPVGMHACMNDVVGNLCMEGLTQFIGLWEIISEVQLDEQLEDRPI